MVLEGFFQQFGQAISNPITYWILAAFFAIVILFLARLFDYPEKQAAIISLIFSVFLLEFLIKTILAPFGVRVDYGTYVIDIPYIFHTTITNGVMLFHFLDFVFDFGLFTHIGAPYYDAFIKTIPIDMFRVVPAISVSGFISSVFSGGLNIFTFIYVNADGIIDYIFFYYFFYAVTVVGADFFGKDDTPYYLGIAAAIGGMIAYFYKISTFIVILIFVLVIILFVIGLMDGEAKSAGMWSFILALMPLGLYSYYISNPISEYYEALPMIQKTIFFFTHGDTLSLIVYFSTMIMSFLLVMEIIALAINILHKLLTTTVKPSAQAEEWTVSHQGLAFDYTLAFAVMYALHQYTWYIFFPAVFLYNFFKNGSSTFIETAKEHVDRLDMQKGIVDQVTRNINGGARPSQGRDSHVADGVIDNQGTNYGLYLIIIAIIGLAAWYFL